MPGEFEDIERLLLPKLKQICFDPFSTNGNAKPKAEHVPSILLRDMREMTLCREHPTGMDFRSSDEQGDPTKRRILYNKRREIWRYWDLSFRADPQRRGRAMQWTAHPVIGALWYVEEMGEKVDAKTDTARIMTTHAKQRLPQGNSFRSYLSSIGGEIQKIRDRNQRALRLSIEAHLEHDGELDEVEPLELEGPSPSDFNGERELLVCENERCHIRYWVRPKKRGRKPAQCPECR